MRGNKTKMETDTSSESISLSYRMAISDGDGSVCQEPVSPTGALFIIKCDF